MFQICALALNILKFLVLLHSYNFFRNLRPPVVNHVLYFTVGGVIFWDLSFSQLGNFQMGFYKNKKKFWLTESCFDCGNKKSAYFGKNYLYEINFCTGLTTLKTNLIFRISHLALCLWAFFAHWQKVQNKDFRGAIVQKQYVLRGSVKLCFEEHRNLTAKNWLCILYSFVTAQC